METEVVSAAAGVGGDFSLWSLFMQADPIVKSVMAILVISSVWSWAVIFNKSITFSRIKSRSNKFEDQFWSGKPLDDLYRKLRDRQDHPMARIFSTGMEEWEQAKTSGGRSEALAISAHDRLDKMLNVAVSRELEKAEANLGVLATVGSVAPFVGLFGTVWGIMNAFQAIGVTNDTNLAVVAPGIAEALFATALGLVAAIPAVIGYNRYSSALNSLAVRLQGFADEFSTILSRQLDARGR
jgi:biopolymer transport protein TolQ